MLGPPKPRRLDEPIAVSLEDLVPASHFYRHLEAKLDLTFVREWTRDLYAERGRPSTDPVIFFKLQLIMFFEDIRSERKLIESASLNLAHRWYVGYALDEALPDHSSLTRIRKRLGVNVFQRFFEKIVDLCQVAGLVWGKELYFDATKVEANAGVPSLIPRFYYDAKTHVADLFTRELADDQLLLRKRNLTDPSEVGIPASEQGERDFFNTLGRYRNRFQNSPGSHLVPESEPNWPTPMRDWLPGDGRSPGTRASLSGGPCPEDP